jgi:acyl carrier protein
MRTLQRLESLFREFCNDPNLHLTRASNPYNVEGWDSIAHVNLIIAIEQEFEIRFNAEELLHLEDAGVMMDLINQKVAK